MIHIKCDFRGLKRLEKDLETFAKKALPFAAKAGLGAMAWATRAEWQKELKSTFNLKNQFTTRSILVQKPTGLNVQRMQAVTYTKAPYLEDQEEGATLRGRGKHKPIPGPVAAGQAAGSKRTRLVRSGMKLSAISVVPGRGRTRKQSNAIALAMARKSGRKFAMLERPRGGHGLFRLSGGAKRIKAKLVWDLSRSSVKLTPEPTLHRTVQRLQPRYEVIWRDALISQLRRHRVWGY